VGVDFRNGNSQQFFAIAKALQVLKTSFYIYLLFLNLKRYKDKLVIQQPAPIRNKNDFNAHRLFRTNDNNTLLSKLPATIKSLRTNTLHSKLVLYVYYKDCTWPSANDKTFLPQCVIHFGYNQGTGNLNKKPHYNSFKDECTWVSATLH
jgi:DNA polymerase-3 subunit alpha